MTLVSIYILENTLIHYHQKRCKMIILYLIPDTWNIWSFTACHLSYRCSFVLSAHELGKSSLDIPVNISNNPLAFNCNGPMSLQRINDNVQTDL